MYHEADPYLKWPRSANVSILLSVGGVFVHVKNEEIAKTLYYYLFVGKPIHWPVDSSYVQWWEKSFCHDVIRYAQHKVAICIWYQAVQICGGYIHNACLYEIRKYEIRLILCMYEYTARLLEIYPHGGMS